MIIGLLVLVYYLFGMINLFGLCFVNVGEIIEVDLGDVFVVNFCVVGYKFFGVRIVEFVILVRCNMGNVGLVNVNLSLMVIIDFSYFQVIKMLCSGVGVVVIDSQNNIIFFVGGILLFFIFDDVDSIV